MPRTKKVFDVENKGNAILQLEKCLHEISSQSIDSRIKTFELSVMVEDITPPILALLVQVLNQPLPKTHNITELKWEICFNWSMFVRPDVTPWAAGDDGFCSLEDIQIFASSLARRTSSLFLNECPKILECLYHTPQLEFNELSLFEEELSPLQCVWLSNVVQRCVSLKDLHIETYYLEETQSLGEGLVNALHLQRVSFKRFSSTYSYGHKRLSDCLVRDVGNCLIGQLLSPQSRLKALALHEVNLEDYHFLLILQMLHTSQLSILDLYGNSIGRKGVLAFARQLPKIKCLKEVVLELNPWEDGNHFLNGNHASYRKCIVALLQGMMENDSIELLRLSASDIELGFSTRVNRARRLILATVHSIPVGLWPWILELVGSGSRNWDATRDEELLFRTYKANALYSVLQNCPILSSIRSSPLMRRSRRRQTVH